MSWSIWIDFNRDHTFGGLEDPVAELENITADVWDKGKVSWELGLRPFEHIADESYLKFEVDNIDRKYSPENTASPLYGYLIPGLSVELRYDSTVMWRGLTRAFTPAPLRYGKRTAAVECVGIKAQLEAHQLYTALYENVTADVVIRDIVTAIAVPPAANNLWLLGVGGFSEIGLSTYLGDMTDIALLDVGLHVFPYVGDNTQGDNETTSAYAVLKALAETERGHILQNRGGKYVFWNRHHLLNDSAVDVTIDNTAADLRYATPIDDLVNHIEVKCYARTESATNTELLWQLNAPLTIPPGTTQVFQADYVDADGQAVGAKNVQTPGGGDVAFSAGAASIGITHLAQRSEVTVTNFGTEAAILQTYNIRGRMVSTRYPAQVYAQDNISMATYGKRVLQLDLKLLHSIREAQSIADFELTKRNNPQSRADKLALKIPGRVESLKLSDRPDGSSPQILYTLGDLVRVMDYQLTHDRLYHIVGERHSLDIKKNMLETEWLLQAIPLTDFWVLGVVGYSEIGVETVLGY